MARAPSRHRLRGRIGGNTTRSRHDPLVYTALARQKFRDSFAEAVDPEGVLPEAERAARADAARRAHMAKLALKSATVRAARRRQASSDGR